MWQGRGAVGRGVSPSRDSKRTTARLVVVRLLFHESMWQGRGTVGRGVSPGRNSKRTTASCAARRDASPHRSWGVIFLILGKLFAMRRPRNFQTDRCRHLVSRVAHRAFYLDEYEPWHEVTPPLPLHQWGQTLWRSVASRARNPGGDVRPADAFGIGVSRMSRRCTLDALPV